MNQIISVIVTLLFPLIAWSAKPYANPKAPVGGVFSIILPAEPPTLHPIKSAGEGYSGQVLGYVMDSLLARHPDTYEWMPWLAEKWDVAKDGKTITFVIREGAKFHNGDPLTVEDVKFSFDVISDPKLGSPVSKSYYANIEKAEIVDPKTIRFHIKEKYFKNLDVVAGLTVIPKSVYSKDDKKLNKTAIGSGPYMFDKYDKGRTITLKRFGDWWGFKVPEFKGLNNFEKINLKIVRDDNTQLELLKKSEIDFMSLTAEQFEKKTDGPMFGTSVMKQEIDHKAGRLTGFIGLNLKNPLFQDRKVRLALAHLLNRQELIRKFEFDRAIPATGPWYRQSPNADPNLKPIEFDPKKAQKLLQEAGWEDSDKNGVLDKTVNGKKVEFRFTVMAAHERYDKYLTIFKEDLKKAGIELNIRQQEWNSFTKALDDRGFESAILAWSSPVEQDPYQIWHSRSDVPGGSNFIAYNNPEVDKLIEKARGELDGKKRQALLRKIYRLIAEDVPYLFLWNQKKSLFAHSSRMGYPKVGFTYGVSTDTWWITK